MTEHTNGYIEITGARENNLKNVSLRIPKHKITIFTGVSGSGKSSIVFDTVAAEGQVWVGVARYPLIRLLWGRPIWQARKSGPRPVPYFDARRVPSGRHSSLRLQVFPRRKRASASAERWRKDARRLEHVFPSLEHT